MFKLETKSGKKIEFCFYHEDHGRWTDCDMVVDGKKFMGTALCHPKDPFVKDVGRKISLAKVMKEIGLNVDERTAVWHRYHARHLSNKEFQDMIDAEYGDFVEHVLNGGI